MEKASVNKILVRQDILNNSEEDLRIYFELRIFLNFGWLLTYGSRVELVTVHQSWELLCLIIKIPIV